MRDKLAVLMEFNGYTKDELEAYLSLKFGSMTKGGMTASILSQSGYEKAKSVIFAQPQLNENQQVVLGQLKINAGSNGSLIKAIHSLFNLLTISSNQLEKDCTEGLLKSKNALARLTRKQAAEVLSAFAQWALGQEEE
ncbi:hypothetical protein [Enterococcus gallinarum]|uniref:hypothetical protein n=1 Tax=Enterococcus gallinarum TaxID=1353 RepID=UPI001F4709F5|nr:hypothetical protein [Enterococcus gallinarum]